MREAILALIQSNESCYDIYIHTGVSQGIISDLRSGYRTLDDVSLKDAERLYDYAQRLAA
ncbi:hypothetical protein [Staphylococcus lutrae]|uniref:Uncharacterized protein n=1 Tax=Staphylococcus lutrae TaxID=155085 RepID=A0AAC9RTT8_9STAP|nr:hypothetical protein [Staphylococcus lutrae]ARJ50560.1 hypothetical protein B5P37_04140 [Staphylococcus lutrae]PNZ36346.1 hypothetical protein CD134_08065 [Staphylococcus lutrae]